MMLVLFTGSRDWTSLFIVNNIISQLLEVVGPFKAIHGGASGLDTLVDFVMKQRGLEVEKVRPRYDRYPPKEAPKRRNLEMLDRSPDMVVGCWTGEKGGTTHCLDFAINVYRIPTLVITI